MIPLALLLIFVYNFIRPVKGKVSSIQDSQESTDVDDEEDEDDKVRMSKKEHKKTLVLSTIGLLQLESLFFLLWR
ncbi:hypothetical protein P7K49_012733 [Saguinus oedipus]|uniref:Uncharacterized protein n=1 Tax=Saguinus oedipus TaxID=9490 RepID=A0ABQ9VDW1_SAGOE|nr:hypothetical protein P7K49_012733 [Saguinus oedipus]